MTEGRIRASLRHENNSSNLTEGQQEAILEVLTAHFCKKDEKYFQYVLDVLFPECVIRLVVDLLELTYAEAERLL